MTAKRLTSAAALLAGAIATLGMLSCGPSTHVVASWKKSDVANHKFTKLMVIGLTRDRAARITVEKELVSRLRSLGYTVISGMDLFPHADGSGSEARLEQAIQIMHEKGVDGVLVIRVVDVKQDENYVPPATDYVPRSYYNSFGNYWVTAYEEVYSPGYTTQSTIVYLESNLYDVTTQELYYSAQTEGRDPSSIKSFASEFSTSLIADLQKNNVIQP